MLNMTTNTYFSKGLLLAVLITFHLIGLFGMLFIDTGMFASLSLYNLLLSLALLLVAHQGSKTSFILLFIPVFIIGYTIELLGVQTGYPFGIYHYGEALGPKLFGVPPIIGVNWFMLAMGAGFLAKRLTSKPWIQVVISSLFMVGVDIPIEQLASALDYWYWKDNHIPIQNFLGWFMIALIMQVLFWKFMEEEKNHLAISYLLVVGVFFVILNIGL